MDTLKAEKRDMSTKAKKLRREGYVTGNIIGREIQGSIPIKMKKQEAERVFKEKKKGSQILLDVDGQTMNVLIKEIDFNFLKNQYEEVSFQALVSNEKVHSVAEIVITNHDQMKEGIIQVSLEEIAFKALPSALVEKVEIDATELKPGDSIKVSDLAIAANPDVDLITDPETVVLFVSEPRAVASEEEEEETSEE
ncbi:MAG: 50S ribosomal protein L25 [Clostridiales bacterium]|nr:50S ribosomal protein L25 [Clostridiales bacterium]